MLDELAKMAKADGDPRPIGQIRADCSLCCCAAPAAPASPGWRAHLTITATLDSLTGASTAAGSVNGLGITAGHARELLARIGALGLTAPEGGSLTFAITDGDGRLLATTTVAELLRMAKSGFHHFR